MQQSDFNSFVRNLRAAGIGRERAFKMFVRANYDHDSPREKRKPIPKVSRKQPIRKQELPAGVLRRYSDGREKCTTAERRRRMEEVWHENAGLCGICRFPVRLERAVPDHINPRGMGGGSMDDRKENLQPAHEICNNEKGSKRGVRHG